jgi:undecaprenyl-diphosphatase
MIHFFLLGIIEGLTEFLPVSSTGHLVLYNYFTGFDLSSPYIKTFEVAIQLGSVLAVIFYYLKEFLKIETLKLLAVSVLPTIVIGFLLRDFVDLLLELPILIGVNLILGGIIILIAENIYKKRKTPKLKIIHYKEGVTLGVVQSLAMMPGVSRSGAVIVYGLFKNFDREVIAKFTFLLAVPTMGAATGYSILKNYKIILSGDNFANLALGFITAFIVALFVVRYALPFIKKYSFVPFGIYRIILGLIVLATIYLN